MSKVDAAWLHMERPTNLMMITGFYEFAGPVDYGRFRETVAQRLVAPFRRFRQRVMEPRRPLASPTWETDPRFDLDLHVHRVGLPAPGDDMALRTLVADLASTPLDFAKPPWQVHLVEGYQGQRSVAVFRLHHCIADGIALIQVMLSMCDTAVDPPDLELPPVESYRPSVSRMRAIYESASRAITTTRAVKNRLLQETRDVLLHPSHLLDLSRTPTSYAAVIGRLTLLPPDTPTLFKGPLGVRKETAWSSPIPLRAVKAVGRVTGATVNDIMLSVVAGALGRYLHSREERVDGVEIRAMMPVNLRTPEAALRDLGNFFGLVVPSLPLGMAAPRARLQAIQERMATIKDRPEALATLGILQTMGMTPLEIEKVGIAFFSAKASAVITNVPGPTQPLYFAGAPVRTVMGWVPQSGEIGLGITIFSYAGDVVVGVITDSGMVPDPETIVAAVLSEFAALQTQLLAERRPAPRSRCQALTLRGNRCKNWALAGADTCSIHQAQVKNG